jgi:hypothetical protein
VLELRRHGQAFRHVGILSLFPALDVSSRADVFTVDRLLLIADNLALRLGAFDDCLHRRNFI